MVALAAVAFGVVGMSAFEAHVINVTATIENALSIPVEPINYGTVFPQEQLDRQITVALSDSFNSERRVDDVSYIIRQKPKCAITSANGTVLVGPTATGHISLGQADEIIIDCGPAPRQLTDGETWGVLPSLCQYLSKHKVDQDNQTQEVEIPAFHQPWTIVGHQVVWNEAKGYLTKAGLDVTDNWNIDLKVPCFGGQCGQDWAAFVQAANAAADPAEYTQSTANEHKVFGCDLWFEVTGVSTSTSPVTP